MTLEELYAKLATVDGGADMVSTIRTEITSLRNEAKANRIAKDDILKQLGITAGEKGTEQTKALADLVKKLQEENKSPAEVVPQLTNLEKVVKELTDKYNAAEKKAQDAEAKRIDSTKTAELVKALTDAKCVSPSQISKVLAGNVRAKEDGSLIYSEDGKTELSIADGVAAYLKANPVFMANTATPGAGSTPPKTDGKHYTPDEIEKMSIEEINANWEKGVADSLK